VLEQDNRRLSEVGKQTKRETRCPSEFVLGETLMNGKGRWDLKRLKGSGFVGTFEDARMPLSPLVKMTTIALMHSFQSLDRTVLPPSHTWILHTGLFPDSASVAELVGES
jgi:hypothetical protein